MRAALDHLAGETLAARQPRRRRTARARRRRWRLEPVVGPFPDIARHVVDAEAVRGKPPHRRGALVPVNAQVLPRELTLPRVRHHAAAGREFVAPCERRAVATAARCVLPLRLAWERLARPFAIGDRIRIRDMRYRVMLPAADVAGRAFRMAPVCPRRPRPPRSDVTEVDRALRLTEDQRAGHERLYVRVWIILG